MTDPSGNVLRIHSGKPTIGHDGGQVRHDGEMALAALCGASFVLGLTVGAALRRRPRITHN